MKTKRSLQILPAPRTDGGMPLATALATRHTVRSFQAGGLDETELGQLLWAAQGVTHEEHKRTAPSASGLHGLETYVVTGVGVSRYLPEEHALEPLHDGDLRAQLEEATGGQPFVSTAPLVIAFATVPGRLAERHGEDRAVRYADFEAGHAGQNLLLQAAALGLGGVPVGSFDDEAVCRLLELPAGVKPRYLFVLGRPA